MSLWWLGLLVFIACGLAETWPDAKPKPAPERVTPIDEPGRKKYFDRVEHFNRIAQWEVERMKREDERRKEEKRRGEKRIRKDNINKILHEAGFIRSLHRDVYVGPDGTELSGQLIYYFQVSDISLGEMWDKIREESEKQKKERHDQMRLGIPKRDPAWQRILRGQQQQSQQQDGRMIIESVDYLNGTFQVRAMQQGDIRKMMPGQILDTGLAQVNNQALGMELLGGIGNLGGLFGGWL